MLNYNKAGILLLAQDRGVGKFGPYILRNNHVLSNTIRRPRYNGLLLDFLSDQSYYTSRGNHFQYNRYYLGTLAKPFFWRSENIGRRRWVGYGQDTRGTFVRA